MSGGATMPLVAFMVFLCVCFLVALALPIDWCGHWNYWMAASAERPAPDPSQKPEPGEEEEGGSPATPAAERGSAGTPTHAAPATEEDLRYEDVAEVQTAAGCSDPPDLRGAAAAHADDASLGVDLDGLSSTAPHRGARSFATTLWTFSYCPIEDDGASRSGSQLGSPHKPHLESKTSLTPSTVMPCGDTPLFMHLTPGAAASPITSPFFVATKEDEGNTPTTATPEEDAEMRRSCSPEDGRRPPRMLNRPVPVKMDAVPSELQLEDIEWSPHHMDVVQAWLQGPGSRLERRQDRRPRPPETPSHAPLPSPLPITHENWSASSVIDHMRRLVSDARSEKDP